LLPRTLIPSPCGWGTFADRLSACAARRPTGPGFDPGPRPPSLAVRRPSPATLPLARYCRWPDPVLSPDPGFPPEGSNRRLEVFACASALQTCRCSLRPALVGQGFRRRRHL